MQGDSQEMCGLLRDALEARGFQVVDGDSVPLRLSVVQSRPNLLKARLAAREKGGFRVLEEGQISLQDRDRLPPAAVGKFVSVLLRRAGIRTD
ncbi:MAG: hypothetical protein QM682_01490 [Paracoccus sp. (in: a-proteobacteria)]|uniref:hypothetical protein n=1 Tax=Paracoccus sp. TaxID=267 RepID=UPI0039E35EAF